MSTKERLICCFNNIGVLFDSDEEDFLISDVIEDSLMFVSMLVEIEQEFDIEIPDDYLAKDRLSSFHDLEELVKLLTDPDFEQKYVCEGGAKMKMALVKPVEGNANTDNWLDLYGEAGGGCGFGCGLDW